MRRFFPQLATQRLRESCETSCRTHVTCYNEHRNGLIHFSYNSQCNSSSRDRLQRRDVARAVSSATQLSCKDVALRDVEVIIYKEFNSIGHVTSNVHKRMYLHLFFVPFFATMAISSSELPMKYTNEIMLLAYKLPSLQCSRFPWVHECKNVS